MPPFLCRILSRKTRSHPSFYFVLSVFLRGEIFVPAALLCWSCAVVLIVCPTGETPIPYKHAMSWLD